MDPALIADLSIAYMRRQQWLARIQAVAIVSLLGEALGGKTGGRAGAKSVGLDGLMSEMGARWQ